MRIACLQFAPQVGDVNNNLNRADAVLSKANIENIDLLVLPELAFSGYNFRSLQHISPYLEPTTSGISSLWARTTALKHNCYVIVGYPEKVDVTPKWPASPEYYNSAITVNRDGETIANYRKSFLYYTDETWALEGPDGFYDGHIEEFGNVAMGICKWPTKSHERMDLNPYKFEAPWSAWEFARHVLHRESNLVILSMAWLTREDARSYSRTPREPDMETLSYWLARMEPIIRNEGEDEIIVVFANRSGVEEEAVYSGTSAVLGIQAGEVKVYGILGRGERELLVVDTNKRPQMMLVSEPRASKQEKNKQKELEKLQSKRYAEYRSPPSSRSSPFDSPRSVESSLSIDTANTSTDPATVFPTLSNVALTPTSPVDHPVHQAYFNGYKETKPRKPTPSPAEPKQRKPTPTPEIRYKPRKPTPLPEVRRGTTPPPENQQQRKTPSPDSQQQRKVPSPQKQQQRKTPSPDHQQRGKTPSPEIQQLKRIPSPESKPHRSTPSSNIQRGPTPAPRRPSSPKSRNTSRNRSRMDNGYEDSPLLGHSVTFEQFTPPIVKDEEEIARILQEINDDDEIVAIESDSDIIEVIDEKLLRMQRVTGSKAPSPEMVEEKMSRMSMRQGEAAMADEEEQPVPGTRALRADSTKERPSNSTSMNPEEWDSNFTKNTLGPRSKHVSPRPKSTHW